jgi:hypothetical protein
VRAIRAARAALTLLEVALAFLILALAIVPILNLFLGTSRMHDRSSGVFREAVAGQLVWEAIKGRSAVNPQFLRDLSAIGFEAREIDHPQAPGTSVLALVHTGGFLEDGGPLDAGGRPLPISPLAANLINRSGGSLSEAANRESLRAGGPVGELSADEVAGLRRSFQDLAVRVWIMDGVLPVWRPGEPPSTQDLRPSETIKDVVIEVFRVGPGRRLPEAPAYRLETVLETPAPSLTLSRLRAVQSAQDAYDYAADLREAYGAIYDAAEEIAMGNRLRRAVADLLLIVVESVGESVIAEGSDLGFGIRDGNTGQGTDSYIARLASLPGVPARQLAADLHLERARNIFTAFRRSQRSMAIVAEHALEFRARLRNLTRALRRLMVTAQTASGPDAALVRAAARARVQEIYASRQRTMVEAAFWYRLSTQERWYRALGRPFLSTYPARYLASLNAGQELCAAIEAERSSTPMEKVRALNVFVELTRAEKLFLGAETLPEDALIRDRAALYAGPMAPYAEALAADDVHNLRALKARNAAVAKVLSAMAADLRLDEPYPQAIQMLAPGGHVTRAITTIRTVLAYFGITGFSGLVEGAVGELVRAVRANVPPPPEPGQFEAPDAPLPEGAGGPPDAEE